MIAKNTICLWFDGTALDAARFYAETFPDSAVQAVHDAPGDYPDGKAGDPITVEFTVLGLPCIGLNGGPNFPRTEAFSFQIATDDQAETDRLWNAIVDNGGAESECGWCKDRWGVNWQITPADPDRGRHERRPCSGCAGLRRDDDDAQDRHCGDRGCSARLTRQPGRSSRVAIAARGAVGRAVLPRRPSGAGVADAGHRCGDVVDGAGPAGVAALPSDRAGHDDQHYQPLTVATL